MAQCKKCGAEVVNHTGGSLIRANPVGQLPAEWECYPKCGEVASVVDILDYLHSEVEEVNEF